MQPLILILQSTAQNSMHDRFERVIGNELTRLGLRYRNPILESRDRWIAAVDWNGPEYGRLARHPELKRSLHALFDPMTIDFFLLTESAYFTKKRVVAFDLDSTLIQAEGIDEFARELGVYEKVAAITERAMKGEMDFVRSFEERVACLRGLTVTQIENVRSRVSLTPGAVELLEGVARFGAKSIILSGGFDRLAELVRTKGPVERIHTNHLEMENGVCTGKFRPPVIDGAKKAELLRAYMNEKGLTADEVIAIGDGSNDIAMLKLAGIGVSYRGKTALNEIADGVLRTESLARALTLLS